MEIKPERFGIILRNIQDLPQENYKEPSYKQLFSHID